MKFMYNNFVVVWIISLIFVSVLLVDAIDADDQCELQAKKIKTAVKACRNESNVDAYNAILSQIASATLTVEGLQNYVAANCLQIDVITECVIDTKKTMADESCRTNSAYSHSIFSLNHVIRLNLFVCGRRDGDILLEAMVPNDGLKCFYGNEKYLHCVQRSESNLAHPDICANIDVRMNCLHTASECRNANAVESFRQLFLLYKEKLEC